MASIIAKNLQRYFKQGPRLFESINFSIASGSRKVLVGPNGSGKTTLLKMIAALTSPSSGHIWVDGICTTDNHRDVQKAVGWVPSDENSFFPRLTGLENLQAFKGPDRSWQQINDDILKLRQDTVIDETMQRPYYLCSRGMKQILNLLRALLKQPKVILLDEPTIGLDQQHQQQMLKLLEIYGKDKTIVMASHDKNFIEDFNGKILSLEELTQ